MKELSKNKSVVVKIVVCEKEIFIFLCMLYFALGIFLVQYIKEWYRTINYAWLRDIFLSVC